MRSATTRTARNTTMASLRLRCYGGFQLGGRHAERRACFIRVPEEESCNGQGVVLLLWHAPPPWCCRWTPDSPLHQARQPVQGDGVLHQDGSRFGFIVAFPE